MARNHWCFYHISFHLCSKWGTLDLRPLKTKIIYLCIFYKNGLQCLNWTHLNFYSVMVYLFHTLSFSCSTYYIRVALQILGKQLKSSVSISRPGTICPAFFYSHIDLLPFWLTPLSSSSQWKGLHILIGVFPEFPDQLTPREWYSTQPPLAAPINGNFPTIGDFSKLIPAFFTRPQLSWWQRLFSFSCFTIKFPASSIVPSTQWVSNKCLLNECMMQNYIIDGQVWEWDGRVGERRSRREYGKSREKERGPTRCIYIFYKSKEGSCNYISNTRELFSVHQTHVKMQGWCHSSFIENIIS